MTPRESQLERRVLGCSVFLGNGIRVLRRRRRNLKHWEKGEPLEGVGDWD
jgi:hypothetical protein